MTPMQYLRLRPAPAHVGLVSHVCADDGHELVDEQTCNVCGVTKPVSEFYFRALRCDYYERCKSCHRTYRPVKAQP